MKNYMIVLETKEHRQEERNYGLGEQSVNVPYLETTIEYVDEDQLTKRFLEISKHNIGTVRVFEIKELQVSFT